MIEMVYWLGTARRSLFQCNVAGGIALAASRGFNVIGAIALAASRDLTTSFTSGDVNWDANRSTQAEKATDKFIRSHVYQTTSYRATDKFITKSNRLAPVRDPVGATAGPGWIFHARIGTPPSMTKNL